MTVLLNAFVDGLIRQYEKFPPEYQQKLLAEWREQKGPMFEAYRLAVERITQGA